MSQDISGILNEWEYIEGKNIRIIFTDSGRPVLQIRESMGLCQCELDGRPDGKVVPEYGTVLEKIVSREKNEGAMFKLSEQDFKDLDSENRLFYYRYLLCFQINDYPRVVRDTEHNMEICRIIDHYCDISGIRSSVLQYQPFLVKINAISRAMIALQKNIKCLAKQILISAIDKLKVLPDIDTSVYILEKSKSITYLETAVNRINSSNTENSTELLASELEKAVAVENYERAAELRDKIKELSKNSE